MNIQNINWNYPTPIWFGPGRIKDIQKACDDLNILNPLIVTDPGILKTDIITKLNNNLKTTAKIYSEVQGNPTGKNVKDGVDFFNSFQNDGVIAVGGGSGMDTGKGIAFMAKQTKPIWDFEDIGDYWTRANSDVIFPIIAVPTTAGTGSETGRAGVFTNEETKVKKIIFHPKMLPSTVILDPELTLPLPSHLTAYTGMDALAHCLEAYCSNLFHPLSQGIALEGISIIKKYLQKSFSNGDDIEARGNMLAASSMGSIAFQKGLGAIHSLSHPVGALYKDKLIALSRYIELSNQSFDGFMTWILNLRESFQIPHTLEELIHEDTKLEEMSAMALVDPTAGSNPIDLNQSDFLKLYKDSFKGIL